MSCDICGACAECPDCSHHFPEVDKFFNYLDTILPRKGKTMTKFDPGSDPDGFCVYNNHSFCEKKDCTCGCHLLPEKEAGE